MPKIRVISLRTNGDIEFKKKKCEINKVEMEWGTVTFKSTDIYGRIRKLFWVIPLWGLKKAYLIVREGDTAPICMGELPQVTQKEIEKFAQSRLLRTLGLDLPRETPIIGIITIMLLFAIAIMQILILSGVRIS